MKKLGLFEKLEFGPHPNWEGAKIAKLRFPNGFGASVITGGSSYTSRDCPYELAVITKAGLCYTTEITDNVLGWQTADDIDVLLGRIAALPCLK